ncbi:MAG: hypothetical protein DRP94_09655 [Candidatus Latescibacterota bacterium]|nr:MAG: hypothetical protein DRP94_09655 [Candidatus Latescibacterota bacterium]
MALKLPVSKWLSEIEDPSEALKGRLRELYGGDASLISERLPLWRRALEAFGGAYGDEEVAVVRSPARINIMGVHIEHRGGWVNYMTFAREVVAAVSPRDDDLVVLHNADPRYPPRSFRISEELPQHKRGRWMDFIEEARPPRGDWANYVKAAVLMLQDFLGERPLKGMEMAVAGDVPEGSGMSSSSALVVASLEAAIWVNRLSVPPEEKVRLGGEGEWYVGTRGGSGDHAAMIFGRRDMVAHIRFFPLEVQEVPFPEGYRVVACHSMREAKKSAGARDIFNSRIASYEIGLRLIRSRFPEYRDKLHHLRDVNPSNLGVDVAEIYGMLKVLPMTCTREEALRALPGEEDALERAFRTHTPPPEGYRVRDVCLFGLAECERGEVTAKLLRDGNMGKLGELMYISHDGDRVVTYEDGKSKPWSCPATDEYLERLILDSQSPDPEVRERAKLMYQPGGYRCSTEELDLIVDICRKVPGVLGAGLTGAGLGGVVLALAEEGAEGRLYEALEEGYYRPRGLPTAVEVCRSVGGACVV